MKQYPSQLKFKKNHRPAKSYLSICENKSFFPLFGIFYLSAFEPGKLKFTQIEACRKSIRRSLRKEGSLVLRVFTYHSITKKPLASRMGKGKGSHSVWVCPIRKGQIICELSCSNFLKGFMALKSASYKLPIKTLVKKISF